MMNNSTEEPIALPSLEPCIIERALDELGIVDPDQRVHLGFRFKMQTESFAIARLVYEKLPTLHDEVNGARSIALKLKQLCEDLDAFQSLRSFPISFLFEEYYSEPGAWQKLAFDMGRLIKVLELLGTAQLANKQPDNHLKHVVGGLMLLLENETGVRATVRRGHADKGTAAQLSSPEARAIAILLRAFEPGLADTTLVNVIEKIRSQNRGGALNEFVPQLWLGRPITAY